MLQQEKKNHKLFAFLDEFRAFNWEGFEEDFEDEDDETFDIIPHMPRSLRTLLIKIPGEGIDIADINLFPVSPANRVQSNVVTE